MDPNFSGPDFFYGTNVESQGLIQRKNVTAMLHCKNSTAHLYTVYSELHTN